MNPWTKAALRLAFKHPGELAGAIGGLAALAKAVGEDQVLAGYLAEATGVPIDQIPRLLSELQAIHL